MFLNYPNNPTGAVVPDGLFERVVELAREHEILVVHDNAYSETTYDGYVAPSFLATPGAKEVGVEVFSLSKGYNMTGWRCAAILGNAEAIAAYWRLKTNIDSGLFEAVQLAGAAALDGPRGPLEEMNAVYARRRDLVVGALREIGVEVEPPKGTIYVWAPVPEGRTSASFAELVLEQAAVVVSPGLDVRAERRGLLPDLADHARRAHQRGRRADARAPDLARSSRPAAGYEPSASRFSITQGRSWTRQGGRSSRSRHSPSVADAQLGIGLALACAAMTNVALLFKHRGAVAAPDVASGPAGQRRGPLSLPLVDDRVRGRRGRLGPSRRRAGPRAAVAGETVISGGLVLIAFPAQRCSATGSAAASGSGSASPRPGSALAVTVPHAHENEATRSPP